MRQATPFNCWTSAGKKMPQSAIARFFKNSDFGLIGDDAAQYG